MSFLSRMEFCGVVLYATMQTVLKWDGAGINHQLQRILDQTNSLKYKFQLQNVTKESKLMYLAIL